MDKVYIVMSNKRIWGVFHSRASAEIAVGYAQRAVSGVEFVILDFDVEGK